MTELMNGLTQGALYALAAVGLSLIFGVVRVPHFAHGETLMVGGMVTLVLAADHGVPLPLAIVIGTAAATLLGVAMGVGIFYPMRRYSETNLLITSLALVFITAAVASKIFGDAPRVIPGGLADPVMIFGARVSEMRLVILGLTIAVFVGLSVWVVRSRAGMAMRAMALNSYAARLMGVRTLRLTAVVFALGSSLAGFSGALLGTILPIQASMGATISLKSFVIIIFAGMGSIPGALVGGLLLGLVETFGGSFLSSGYINSYAFIFLVAVLVVRPQGLFVAGANRD
jgi:branched-chain amino acid transport system permease protein